MADAPAAASASAAEPFSIRAFVARIRSVNAAKCYPFGGGAGCGDGEAGQDPPPWLPPMDPPPRSRWWQHELAAARVRLSAGAKGGGEAGDGLRKGTKRTGSRSGTAAERAKKRRRVLQFRSLLKNKERTSKSQSTSRLHQHMLHMGLLRQQGSSVHSRRELAPRKELEEAWDHMPPHANSLIKQNRGRVNPSTDMHSSRRKEEDSFVNKQSIKVSGSTNYQNPGRELVKHAAGPNDDIFGDLPLLDSSKIMFRTGVDELPTVMEESFITNQSGPDAVPLKLLHTADITAQTPSAPLEDLVNSEVAPDQEPSCISHNDAVGSHPATARINEPYHERISMVKTYIGYPQQNCADGSALSSYSDLRSKCGSNNLPQGCFDRNTNCSQEITKHGTSSATSPPVWRTRTEGTKSYKDTSVNGKKGTDSSAPVVGPKNHFSSQGRAIAQGVVNARTDADDISSCRSMPAIECISTSRPSGNFTSNTGHENRKHVDAYVPLSTENQGSWYSKLQPICSPASIGSAFMKLPGLERMEISSGNVKTGENKFIGAQAMNTVRFQKQKLVTGMTHIVQGQEKIGFSNSQAGKSILEGYVVQDVSHPQQPTMRLMGKTVSVCKHRKDYSLSTMGKVCPNNITIKENHLSTISCHLPQKRSFPYQDSVMPRAHLNDSSDFLARIPDNPLSGQKTTFNDFHNQSPQPISSVSSTRKDCTWNFGSQFVQQAELNKASMVSANSEARHVEIHRPPHMMSIPHNQQSHLCTPASRRSRDDHSFVGPAWNQPSPIPQELLKASMKEKYQKSTLSSYDDPSSAPIRQPYRIPGTKLSSATTISFYDYGANNCLSKNSSPGLCPSPTTSLANNSVSASGPTCTGSITNSDDRLATGFANQINGKPPCADNVSQQPAKKLATDRLDFTCLGPNMIDHSLGWSLNDAVRPRIVDFRVTGDTRQVSRHANSNLRLSSGPLPAAETRPRTGFVAGVRTMLKPGENLKDHSKLLQSTTFPVGSGANPIVL